MYSNVVSDYGEGLIACSWMDFHTDEHCVDECGCYTLEVVDVLEDCMFIHTVGGVFVGVYPKSGDVIKFKAVETHGLFPSKLGSAILMKTINLDTLESLQPLFNGRHNYPVMIWKWL
jgi:hypothetical protein